MDRIDHASAEADLHGAGKDGFTAGDPVNGVEETVVTDDWLNAVQEEVLGVIEAAGLTPLAGDLGQLDEAIGLKIGQNFRVLESITSDSDSLTLTGSLQTFEESAADITATIPVVDLVDGAVIKAKMIVRHEVAGSGTPPTNLNANFDFDQASANDDAADNAGSPSLGATVYHMLDLDLTVQEESGGNRVLKGTFKRVDNVSSWVDQTVRTSLTLDADEEITISPQASMTGGSAGVCDSYLEVFRVEISSP